MGRRLTIAAVLVAAGLGGAARAGDEAASRRRGRIAVVAHTKSEMVRVPAGTFVMGFPDEKDGGESTAEQARADCEKVVGAGAGMWCTVWVLANLFPQDQYPLLYLMPYQNAVPQRDDVFLPTYEIDRFEVTVAQYRRCVADGGCDSGALLQGDQRHHRRPSNPIVNVTWREATDYCAWAGKRLPTEAEWEKAARATDGRRWPWGNQDRKDGGNHGRMDAESVRRTRLMKPNRFSSGDDASFELAPDDGDGAAYPVPPGTLRWSEGRYGTYDMAGNVAEWVFDYYSPTGYADLPRDAPVRRVAVDRDSRRVVRGGSWLDLRLSGRAYARSAHNPAVRSPLIGFRCAR
ncbi:MAG TPA: formylglycine-generating enzyme family protein [Kofleriaceae bacterium]|nr:formylglycine-generating enzyme family protein [Kofleriaceae bacterium]